MSYYGVFHGDRRESSKLKTALRKRPVCPDGFSFSAASSYRYIPPCTSTQRSNHAKRDPAPALQPRSLYHLSTGQLRRKILVHRNCPQAPRRRNAVAPQRTTIALRQIRRARQNALHSARQTARQIARQIARHGDASPCERKRKP